jgi:fibronectin-binding autotransporter adhesin
MQMMKFFKTTWLCAVLLCFGFGAVQASTVTNADVPDNLNLGTSWVGGTAAGSGDVALWDKTVQTNTTKTLGADLSWAGIQIVDPATNITINAGNTLTLGASGIDMSLATQDLLLNNAVVLGANQIWNITNGHAISIASAPHPGLLTGSGTLTKNGNGTLILRGLNTYTGGTIVNGGILQINSGTTGTGTSGTNSAGIGGMTLNNGATLQFGAAVNMGNTFTANGTVFVDMNTNSGSTLMNGSWFSSGGTVIITNAIIGTTFTIGGNGVGGGNMNSFTGAVVMASTTSLGNSATNSLRLNDSGGNNNTGNTNASFDLGNGVINLTARNRTGSTINLGALSGGTNTSIKLGSSGTSGTTYSIGGKNIATTFDGKLDGTGTTASMFLALTKVGTNVFTLTGANTYNGTTTITAGTLQIGNGGTSGQLGTGSVVNNASLIFNRSDDIAVTNGLTGSGMLIKTNANTMTYNGTNNSSGATIVNQGVFVLGASGLMTCPVSVGGGATFDLSQNPTIILNSTLSGSGVFTGLVTSASGTISPGGSGAAGTINFSNGITESGSVTHQMELSSVGGSNDLINITGDLTASGANNTFSVSHFSAGAIPNGTYTLLTYSGNFNGSLANFVVNTPGGTAGVLGNPPNQITITISPSGRGATNLAWVGDGGANNWDTGASNWVNGAAHFVFQTGDSVLFDATGASNPTVNLNISVLPASVLVSNATAYTITGNGNISDQSGALKTGLVKTNSGTLNLLTTNSYTGPTIIGGGTLAVNYLANGSQPSGIGAANSNPTNLVLVGSTLSYTGLNANTDRGATLSGSGGVFDVIGGTTLALDGNITGSGALIKLDSGTLTLDVPNTYTGGTVISNGVLALGSNSANNNGTGGSGVGATNQPVTFSGGTLQLYGYGLSSSINYNTFYNPLVVPTNQTGTLLMFPRGQVNTGSGAGLNSSLSGGGTLNLKVNSVRDALSGNWSAFTGLIIVSNVNASADEFRINNNFGYANAAIYLNGTFTMDSTLSSGATINIGELGGVSTAIIGSGNSSQPNPTWIVGWKNSTNTFAGIIANDGTTSITKVGTGTWILSGVNTYSGTTTISNGVLALSTNSAGTDGSIASSSTNMVVSPGILDVMALSTGQFTASTLLAGNGTVNGAVYVNGALSPFIATNVFGTFTITSNLLVDGTVNFYIDETNGAVFNDKVVCTNITINSGATINVTQASTNDLHTGDTFQLFSTGVSFPGGFPTINITPATTQDGLITYGWDTSQLATNGTLVLTNGATSTTPPAPVAGIGALSITNIFVTQSVTFTNLSSGSITNWIWNFGDGSPAVTNATGVNISHQYNAVGVWLANLTVVGAGGSNTSGNLTVTVKGKVGLGKPVVSAGSFIVGGTNGPAGQTYRILSTTNVATAVVNWVPVYTNVFANDGSYSYTNSPLTNKATFFKLVSP